MAPLGVEVVLTSKSIRIRSINFFCFDQKQKLKKVDCSIDFLFSYYYELIIKINQAAALVRKRKRKAKTKDGICLSSLPERVCVEARFA